MLVSGAQWCRLVVPMSVSRLVVSTCRLVVHLSVSGAVSCALVG